jgi:undecaprenyl diphosphate synthase
MISNLYEKRLMDQIEVVPKNITLVIADTDLESDDAFKKIESFVIWCKEVGVDDITVYISIMDMGENVNQKLRLNITKKIEVALESTPYEITMFTPEGVKKIGKGGKASFNISIGYGGKKELSNAIRSIAHKITSGELNSDEITEETISSHLVFKSEPDLVIRTGEQRLTDFLIWQAVYSELYFAEVNWADFRRMDLLRAIRDYQKRQRRFGK